MNNEKWLQRDKEALASVLPRCSDVVAARGKGSYLWDADVNLYLDFTSGIATTSTGHCHPKVVDAIKLQASTLIHTSVTTHNKPSIQLAEKLRSIVPIEDAQVFFCNSGAEAVDGAWKLARMVTQKPGIIRFHRAFHGRTLAATSLTSAKEKYWQGYQPLLEPVYGGYYGEKIGWYTNNVGAVIVEPILGEGGYVVPPDGWLQHLKDYCDQYDLLLIFDEVQTGVGRTGNWWAADTFGVTPDVILFAKGIASGLPLGGIIASRQLMDRWPTGTHGSTFGGNPVSCAAALATLDVIEPLLPEVREMGDRTIERLSRLPFPVRGRGLMIGIELPSSVETEKVKEECQRNGLLILSCGPGDNVIRLVPPLTIGWYDLEKGISILETALGNI